MYIHMEATHTEKQNSVLARVFREAFTDEAGLELNFKGRQNFKKGRGGVISYQITPLAQNRAKHGTS